MSKCKNPTEQQLQEVKEVFYLDKGVLKFSIHRYKSYVGREVCKNQKTLRKMVWCAGRSWPLHRIVYFLHHGSWPKGVVDHINGDPTDNRPENLRDTTQQGNCTSYVTSHCDSSSSYRGVSWYPRYNKWEVSIMFCGKREYLGRYENEDEAAMIWNLKAQELGFNPEAFNKVY